MSDATIFGMGAISSRRTQTPYLAATAPIMGHFCGLKAFETVTESRIISPTRMRLGQYGARFFNGGPVYRHVCECGFGACAT